jgi:hypothetical protein
MHLQIMYINQNFVIHVFSCPRKTTYDVSSLDRTYAVAMQAGRFTRYTADSPAAAWYTFYLFHKNVAPCATFL